MNRRRALVAGLCLIGGIIALAVVLRGSRSRSEDSAGPGAGTQARGRAPDVASSSRSGPDTDAPSGDEPSAEKIDSCKSGCFEGRVVSALGDAGVADAELSFENEGVTASTITGKDGSFTFEAQAPGVHNLIFASAPGHEPFNPEWGHTPVRVMSRPGERVRGVTIVLAPIRRYTGVVRGPDGRGAARAEVRIIGARRNPTELREARFTCDENGEFELTAPDDAIVEARAPRLGTGRARVDHVVQVTRRLVIRLSKENDSLAQDGRTGAERIAGKVVGPAGEPVSDALVEARKELVANTVPGDPGVLPVLMVRTDEQGRFVVDGIDPGTYDLTASSDGEAARARNVASGAQNVELVVKRAGSLRGAVEDESGKPVASFVVVVTEPRGQLRREPMSATSFVDPEGRYEVTGLVPGEYAVSVFAAGHVPSQEKRVSIPERADGPIVLDFDVSRGGRVRGRVLDRSSKQPIAGASVSFEGGVENDFPAVQDLLETRTDGRGDFELTGSPPGPRSIQVTAAGHHHQLVQVAVPAALVESAPVLVELAGTRPGEDPQLEMTGIGIVGFGEDDALLVREVFPGAGASEAGIRAGDEILAVDGQSVAALGVDRANEAVRGPAGSTVDLTIRRAGTKTVSTMTVRRRPFVH
jgi:hypothetical protein